MAKAYDIRDANDILYIKAALSNVFMILFHKDKLKSFLLEAESSKPSLYILYNENRRSEPGVYIGETENIGERLKQHDAALGKSFFTHVIIFQTAFDELNKAHYKHLEYLLYEDAIYANRSQIMNKVSPTKSALSSSDQVRVELFIKEIKELLLLMRFFFLEHEFLGNTGENDNIYYAYHSFGTGKLVVRDFDNYVIIEGSIITPWKDEGEDPFLSLKKKLLKERKIEAVEDTELFLVKKEIKFESTNDAAMFILGHLHADWTYWTNIQGQQLK